MLRSLQSLFAASVVAISLVLSAAPASAQYGGQYGGRDDWLPKAQGNRIGLDFDWWGSRIPGVTDRTRSALAFGVVGQVRVARGVFLDFDIPWAGVAYEGSKDHFAFGNPTIGAHWAAKVNENFSAFVGGSLTVSTLISGATTDVDADYATRYLAIEARSFLDAHRFLPDYFMLRARGGFEVNAGSVFFYRFEAAPLIAIPVGELADEAEVFFDLKNDFELRSRGGVGGGVSLNAVVLTSRFADRDDSAQASLEPYFVFEPRKGFYAHVGTLIALDDPLGFGFDEYKVFTLRASLGGKW